MSELFSIVDLHRSGDPNSQKAATIIEHLQQQIRDDMAEIDQLTQDRDRWRAEAEKAKGLLQEVQWGSYDWQTPTTLHHDVCCPWCGGHLDAGHSDDCQLAAALTGAA